VTTIHERIESIRPAHHKEFKGKMLPALAKVIAGPLFLGIYIGHSWFGHVGTSTHVIYACVGVALMVLCHEAFAKIFVIGNQDDRSWVLKCTELANSTDELHEVGIGWDHIEALIEREIDQAFDGYDGRSSIQGYLLTNLHNKILECRSVDDLNWVLHWDRPRGVQVDHIKEIASNEHWQKQPFSS